MNFIIALLTGLGVGSGGLYILYLTLFHHIPQAEAQGLNLVFFITASLAASLVNTFKKRISWTAVIILALSGIPGAVLGSFLARKIEGELLSNLFNILLLVAGTVSLFKKNEE
ncbi:MAG: sulfite exporter TauE/SafE family protein [Clostridia bacterium]|nr:sulfite exporter TauE/SafE family protein [Clostridia bacterium]